MFRFLWRCLMLVFTLLILAVVAIYGISEMKIRKTYTVAAETVAIPTDPESLAHGQHLATVIGKCIDCHGTKFEGSVLIDDPALGRIAGPNLTTGEGGLGGQLKDEDWIRAIRHGVMLNGRSVTLMPADLYNSFSEHDLGSLIAYLKSVPPVDNTSPSVQLGPLFRFLIATNQAPLLTADLVDHDAPPPPAVDAGVTEEYGRYLATVGACVACHGANLAGGPIPGAPPDAPKALNISQGGEPGGWTEEQFKQTLKTGTTPSGRNLDPEWMPWKLAGQMTEDELSAVWLYLKSMPPVKSE